MNMVRWAPLTALVLTAFAGCGGPDQAPAADSAASALGAAGPGAPESGWGAPYGVCWWGPPHWCIEDSQMFVDGCDNRNPGPLSCDSTPAEPFAYVGRTTNGCTGTLITPYHVLTNAHCVTAGDGLLKNSQIGFTPAQVRACSNGGCPFGTHYARRVFAPKRYRNAVTPDLFERKAYDVAILELANPVPLPQVPFYNLPGPIDVATIAEHTLYSLGYPGDKDEGTVWTVAGEYNDHGSFAPGVNTLQTSIDGHDGQSGSPVYLIEGEQRKLLGVLVGSTLEDCQNGNVWVAHLTSWIYSRVLVPAMFWDTTNIKQEVDVWVPRPRLDVPGECGPPGGGTIPPAGP